jgi:tripartite-type tricarboxylate transporter receptor subunit TctC
MVMPFPPGSGTDLLARVLADELSRKWGQTVMVDNSTGAGGNIGAANVYRSAPDGYTLLFVPPPPLVINQAMYKNIGSDPSRWATITIATSVPYVLAVRPDFPASSVSELIALAQAQPDKLTYASASVGSTAQLSMLQLEMMTGIKMVHVPYRGAAPALVDVMAGHVDMVFDTLSTSLPVWQAGKIKVLGVGSKTRAPDMPDVPSVSETVPGFQSIVWFGMVAPPQTPPAIVDKISADMREILKKPDVVKKLHSMNMEPVGTTPVETRKYLDDETALWGKIIKDANITID